MSRTFRLQKLVRDNIVDFNEAQGATVDYRALQGSDLQQALVAKLLEEATELQKSTISVDELADVQEVLDQLMANAGVTKAEVQTAQEKKNAANGSFAKGHFIETLTLPEGNEWIDYYAADPEKYPEITHE